MQWIVQTNIMGDWLNTWTDGDDRPITYTSQAEAEAAVAEYLAEREGEENLDEVRVFANLFTDWLVPDNQEPIKKPVNADHPDVANLFTDWLVSDNQEPIKKPVNGNEKRRKRAEWTLRAYAANLGHKTQEDFDTEHRAILTDVLTDVMHWSFVKTPGLFDRCLYSARNHFAAEIQQES